MCIKKLKNTLLKRRKSTSDEQEYPSENTAVLEAVDVQINKKKTYFCICRNKKYLVLYFDIINKSNENLILNIEVLPSGTMVDEIARPWADNTNGVKIFSNSVNKKIVSATYNSKPFKITANSCEQNRNIIVKVFNINSDLQLAIKSGGEVKKYPIKNDGFPIKNFN